MLIWLITLAFTKLQLLTKKLTKMLVFVNEYL